MKLCRFNGTHLVGFLKATSSVVARADGIAVHFPARRTDHAVELAIAIGKTCKNILEADASTVVAGYCIGLDITIRGSEDRSFRKSIDDYTVLGPWFTTADEIADPDSQFGATRQWRHAPRVEYEPPDHGTRKKVSRGRPNCIRSFPAISC
jgi:2-keto-4-pentenoate hydratase/2-oxohepta-3-ene-1,7-dioic acid hydratase in catechol pathway